MSIRVALRGAGPEAAAWQARLTAVGAQWVDESDAQLGIAAGDPFDVPELAQHLDQHLPGDSPMLVTLWGKSATDAACWVTNARRLVGVGPLWGSVIELARPIRGSEVLFNRALHLLTSMGLEATQVKDQPGLVLGRILVCLFNEAVTALDEGLSDAAGLDLAMRLGVHYPKGPLAWLDEIGPGRVLAVLDNLFDAYGEDRYRPAPFLKRLVMAGISVGQWQNHRQRDWDEIYRGNLQEIPWEAGKPSHDLVRLLESGRFPQGKVLEVGCGTGTDAIYLARHGREVTAVDVSDVALELARKKALQAGVQVQWLNVASPELPFDDNSFDAVYDRGVYHLFDREGRRAHAKAIARVLKPGGVYVMTCFSEKQPGEWGPKRLPLAWVESEVTPEFAIEESWETVLEGNLDPLPLCRAHWMVKA